MIDRHHPLSGRHLHGRLLAIPGGRGSCTGSSVLLELILGGCLFIYLIYARGTDETGKSFIRKFFAIAAVAAFIVNGAMLYDYIQADGELALSLRAFERLFNFWI